MRIICDDPELTVGDCLRLAVVIMAFVSSVVIGVGLGYVGIAKLCLLSGVPL
jgi:hypothetical protein